MTCDGKKNSRRKAYPRSDMSGYASLRQYAGELRFFDVSAREAAALMDAGESFALLAAFANCPWCAAVIPALNDAAIEHGADLLYLNTRRDPAVRRNTEIEGFDEFYARFSELLGADEHLLLLVSPEYIAVRHQHGPDGFLIGDIHGGHPVTGIVRVRGKFAGRGERSYSPGGKRHAEDQSQSAHDRRGGPEAKNGAT